MRCWGKKSIAQHEIVSRAGVKMPGWAARVAVKRWQAIWFARW
jgi:hypothetical protein